LKTIIIFGASGQLGRAWQTFFDQSDEQEARIIPLSSSQVDITQIDDLKRALQAHQPDIIINCAAYTNVDSAEDEPEKARRVNAAAVKKIAELCSKHHINLVHFSTDYIFAGTKDDCKRFPNGYTENHPAQPVNLYGETKWEGEQAIRRAGCRYLIMRVSWLCGDFGNNFVKTMLRLGQRHQQIEVVGDQWGSPAFADNLVENTFILLENGCQGTYHLASKGLINWADFAAAIFEYSSQPVKVNRISAAGYSAKAPRPCFSKLNTRKIEQVEGVHIETWRTGLQRLLQQLD
jgi:dTDP-4-dehydrorhamnose reductase